MVANPRLILFVLLAGSLIACGELAHTNPVDPDAEVAISISGPLEIHSLGQQVEYTFTSVPAWTYSAPRWESSAPGVLALDAAGGRFVSKSNGDAMVTVHLGPHTATAISVRVLQTAAGVTVRTCDGSDPFIERVGLSIPICAGVRDSIGSLIEGKELSATPGDTAVVVMSSGRALGRSCGSTYLRAGEGSWRDSLLVKVCP